MAWQVGEKLKDGRYTIEQVLGHSGFGQTYVAVRNTGNSERVVLKHLKQEIDEDDTTFRDRQTAFTNEAIRLASCEHSHIVKVRPETFWERDLVHMVMEHIQGENLEVLVKQRQKPLPLDEALRYIAQVASALEHIHNFDPPLIHRDVKPANIVLRNQNREAVLVDFGSAKEVRAGASLSLKSIYTAGYSAIEIYSGIKKDTYTDVYSLGATLYFLLTTKIPTPVQQRVIEDLDIPIHINSSISQRVNDAIMAAMEIKPKDRVQTVSEFMQRLGQPLKPSVIHQGLQVFFGAKVVSSNPQADKQIAEQAAKIAAAEKQANLERQRREQVEQESQAMKKQLRELEADKQRLAREQQKAESESQQRQREAQVVREQLQQSEAEKQRLAELQRTTSEKEREAQVARKAQVKADKERQSARDAQIRVEQAKREAESKKQQLQQPKIELRSAKGIDYRELEKLLKNKQWYEADRLTYGLMFKASGREQEGWGSIDLDSIRKFPCTDLHTIDNLWMHHSGGLYGFSIQRQIYAECGGKLDFSYPNSEIWDKFCDRTAWTREGKEVYYPQPFFENNLMNVKGHLPRLDLISIYSLVYFWVRMWSCWGIG
jgi:serine/threonine protein kinase